MRDWHGDGVLVGVCRTFKVADKMVRASLPGAKFCKEQGTWYRDKDSMWYSVTKEEVLNV